MIGVGRCAVTAGLVALVLLGLGDTAARAALSAGDIKVEALDAAGEPETRAGAHPDRLVTSFQIEAGTGEAEDLKDMVIDFPAGFGGDPRAVPLCPRPEFEATKCSGGSQVGETVIEGANRTESFPIYSLEPGPNEAATFGSRASLIFLRLTGSLRPSDYGFSIALQNMVQGEPGVGPLKGAEFVFWGVPADHQEGSSIPRRAFLTNPTRCGEPLTITVHARTWQEPDHWIDSSAGTGIPLGDCQGLPFEPRFELGLDNPRPDSPTGAGLSLTFATSDDADRRAHSQAKDVSVVLPDGMGLSPAAADGLGSCSDDQFGLAAGTPPACPPSSRVGTMEMATPQLGKPLTGTIYLGRETAEDRFRLFILASGQGTEARFIGALRADPETGRLTAKLSNLPQISFERLNMRFDGGPRALLVTPLSCGSAKGSATFTPYSGTAAVESADAVAVEGPAGSRCPQTPPFAPTFIAASSTPQAGRPTSFSTTIYRRDGEQLPGRFSVTLPAGLSAALGSVDLCPDGAACPPSSRVGSALVEVGTGANPAPLTGDVYLTGPYRRAPFGLALSFRAVIGPFDLGRFVVRAALRPDPLSGQITIDTDALPQSVGGLPIRMRTIGLDIDRPGFIYNPTSCTQRQASAAIRSVSGATAQAASDFSYRGCLALRFRPTLAMAMTGRSQLREGGKPGLRILLRTPRGGGNTNLRAASFSLPRLLRFDASGLREICARGEAAKGNCPLGSRVGSGYARTPLLDGPLRGSIYLVQPRDSGSPDLWTSLEGEGFEVNLRGETAIRDGRVEAALVDLPDFPLTSFAMRLTPGKHGIFKLRKSPCVGRPHLAVPLALEGQNRARRGSRARLSIPASCGDG